MDPAAGSSSSSSIGGATGNNPLDLRNLLNIDRADRVFQELLRQVAVQSAEIRELRQLLARCVTQEMLQKVGAALQGNHKGLDQRVSDIEESMGGGRGAGKGTVGERLLAAEEALAELATACAGKAEHAALQTAVATGRKELAAEAAVLREDLATKEFCDSLEASGVLLQDQMTAMNGSLSLKADRAQLAAIEATCSKLRAFNDYVEQSKQQIATLEEQMAAARKELDESVSPQLATLNGDAARLTAGLEETTAFSREGVGRLTEGLKALRADFEAASAAAAAREKEVDGGLAQCKESILLLKGHLDDQVGVCNARLQEISDELKIVPTAANLDDKVGQAQLRESEAQLMAMVERKAGLTSFVQLRSEVDDLKGVTLPGHEKQIGLALRFIDWFSERGESYEHNLRAMDRHLGQIAYRSAPPGSREPYDGTTRFTPLDIAGDVRQLAQELRQQQQQSSGGAGSR